MPVFEISALDDPRLAPYRDLTRRRAQAEGALADIFIAESPLAVRRLLASPYRTRSLLVTAAKWPSFAPLAGDEVDVFIAPPPLIKEITGFDFHRGALACGERRPRTAFSLAALTERPHSTVVLVDAVSDPANLGSIVRGCRAFGVDALIIGPGSADVFSRRAIRVSMGSVFTLPLVTSDDLVAVVQDFKRRVGAKVFAAVLDDDATPLKEARRAAHTLIMLGSEHDGLSETLRQACDEKVVIPMAAGADSLNVAAASAVLLYALAG